MLWGMALPCKGWMLVLDAVFEIGSSNIFADLELDDADELYARAQLGILVLQLLKAKNIKQREMTAILGIKQTDVSHIMNGHFSRFSQERLIGFLNKLEQKVTIQVIRHCRGEPINKLVLG